jgi:asparagine synthase (glutamine-hydrolysing)
MCDVQAHRGPDDAGYVFLHRDGNEADALSLTDDRFGHVCAWLPRWEAPASQEHLKNYAFDVALGHRRLSILDLSPAGHQPMATPDGRYWICYNGELYNSPELRRELLADGIKFRSRSDTEVLLRLWEKQGPAALPRLDGMYAFAVVDLRVGSVTLARDRFGVKPVYYAETPECFLFASEIKALLASGLIRADFDIPPLAEYLTFQNLLGSETLFKDIVLLPAGSYRTISFTGGSSPTCTYYRCYGERPAPDPDARYDQAAEDIRERFQAAVSRQLLSDVPVGSYLSSGLDSGSIVSVGSGILPRLATFTGGVDLEKVEGMEARFDERQAAELLSNRFHTEHYSTILRPKDLPALMEKVIWHLDDPRLGMCYQNYHVAHLAGRMVKVCLSGAGGDELFGGYPWRYAHGVYAASVSAFDEAYFQYWHRLLPPERLPQVLSEPVAKELPGVRERFFALIGRTSEWSPHLPLAENLLQRALGFEFHTFLQGFLIVEDRLSMSHSLETRVPFLDNALAEQSFRLRPVWKVNPGTGRIHTETTPQGTGKQILRKAMEPLLPAWCVHQAKQGFSTPEANWYRGPVRDYLREILLDGRAQHRYYLRPGAIARILKEHEEGSHNHRLLIWSLLSLEWLNRHYVDQALPTVRAA